MTRSTTSQRLAVFAKSRLHRLALFSVLTLVAGTSYASDCALQLSQSEVDYGAINRDELPSGRNPGAVALGARPLTLNVVCKTPGQFTLGVRGQRTNASEYKFSDNSYFRVRIRDATVDGAAVQLLQSAGASTPIAAPSSTVQMTPDVEVTAVSQNSPVKGKTMTATIDIEPFVGESEFAARDVRRLVGQGGIVLLRR